MQEGRLVQKNVMPKDILYNYGRTNTTTKNIYNINIVFSGKTNTHLNKMADYLIILVVCGRVHTSQDVSSSGLFFSKGKEAICGDSS